MWHAKPSKILTHCKLISGTLFTYLQTDIWNDFPQRSALQLLQYIFSYLRLYTSTLFSEYYSLEIHERFSNVLLTFEQCYFFSSVCKLVDVFNFYIRKFDNIEVVSFHKHFCLYWSSITTSRCRDSCVLYGTWLWVVKKHVRHEWFPMSCRMTYFATYALKIPTAKTSTCCAWATDTRYGHRKAWQQY